MGIRTALRQIPAVTFAALLAVAWTLLVGYEVATAFDWLAVGGGFVGENATAGVVGVAVLALALGLLVGLLGELSEHHPAPEAWPPE